MCPPNIYDDGKPIWSLGVNLWASVSGPCDRYSCYRNTAAVSIFCPGIDVAAVGGLVTPQHHVEAMMLGANITELSSGLFWKGTFIIKQTVDVLRRYMEDYDYETVEDFRGLGLKYFQPIGEADWKFGKVVAVTDYSKCNGCEICARNVCFAIYMKGRKARTIPEECTGCGLCEAICPQDARKVTATG